MSRLPTSLIAAVILLTLPGLAAAKAPKGFRGVKSSVAKKRVFDRSLNRSIQVNMRGLNRTRLNNPKAGASLSKLATNPARWAPIPGRTFPLYETEVGRYRTMKSLLKQSQTGRKNQLRKVNQISTRFLSRRKGLSKIAARSFLRSLNKKRRASVNQTYDKLDRSIIKAMDRQATTFDKAWQALTNHHQPGLLKNIVKKVEAEVPGKVYYSDGKKISPTQQQLHLQFISSRIKSSD